MSALPVEMHPGRWWKLRGTPERRVMLLTEALELPAAQLAAGLAARGWKVSAVSLTTPSPLPVELEEADLMIADIASGPRACNPRAVWRLCKLIRDLRPQVLHAHLSAASIVACVLRLVEPVPALVCTLHPASRWRKLVQHVADRTTLTSPDPLPHSRRESVPCESVPSESVPSEFVPSEFVIDQWVRTYESLLVRNVRFL